MVKILGKYLGCCLQWLNCNRTLANWLWWCVCVALDGAKPKHGVTTFTSRAWCKTIVTTSFYIRSAPSPRHAVTTWWPGRQHPLPPPCLYAHCTPHHTRIHTQWHSHRDTAVITFTFMLVLMLLCRLLSKVIELAKPVCKILQLFNCLAEYNYLFENINYVFSTVLQGVSDVNVLLNRYFLLCESFTGSFDC